MKIKNNHEYDIAIILIVFLMTVLIIVFDTRLRVLEKKFDIFNDIQLEQGGTK